MMRKLLGISLSLFFSVMLFAQESHLAENMGTTVVYQLPATSMHLEVSANRTVYTPGPYAKYAEKYLGIRVAQEYEEFYELASVKMVPYLEADRSEKYHLEMEYNSVDKVKDLFLKFSSQGMVMLLDQYKGSAEYWRFPTLQDNRENIAQRATNNFTSAETILYKNVKNKKGGYDRVAISQTQVVKKSLETKASEAADAIFAIRRNRMAIITGDTDATFSGDALRASVETLDRLEEEYLSLFLGSSETTVQQMEFDVLPKAEKGRQIIVAFRFSDENGLAPASEITGRPVVMEIIPEDEDSVSVQNLEEQPKKKGKVVSTIYYRVPAVCQVRLLDATDLLLQSRVPVYQVGEVYTFPITL